MVSMIYFDYLRSLNKLNEYFVRWYEQDKKKTMKLIAHRYYTMINIKPL